MCNPFNADPSPVFFDGKTKLFEAGSSLPVPYECCRHVKPFSCWAPVSIHQPSTCTFFCGGYFCTMDLEASIFYQYIHTFLSQAPAQLWAWVDPACGQVHNILNTTRCINKTPKNIMHFDFPPFHTPQKRRGSHDLMAIFMGVRVPWAFKVSF